MMYSPHDDPDYNPGHLWRLLSTIAVAVLAFIVIGLTMGRAVGVYDEGIILTGAARVAAGDLIHRDFYANYGPAEFYLLAKLFALFGQDVLVERVFDLFIRAGIAGTVWFGLQGRCRQWAAVAATLATILWLAGIGNPGYPIYPAILLALCATLLLTGPSAGQGGAALWAGLMVGAAALFRYDLGFLAFVAHALAMLISPAPPQGKSKHPRLHALLPYSLGAALPVAAVLITYWFMGALDDFVYDVIAFPAHTYLAMRGLPFPKPSFTQASIYIPPLAAVVAFGVLIFGSRGMDDEADRRRLGYLLLLSLALYLKGTGRVSLAHIQAGLLPSLMVLALAVGKRDDQIGLSGVLASLLLAVSLTNAAGSVQRKIRTEEVVASDIQGFMARDTGRFFADGPDREAAILYLRLRTKPDERVFIGLAQHDRIFVNDVSAYFLLGRQPATKWHHFDPGLQTRALIQQAIIDELEAVRPSYAWIESTWDDVREPNLSAQSTDIHRLDDYLARRYAVEARFGTIQILRRKPEVR